MWHEAARSMDAATRVELRYMNERLALPFETWNYAHNRNYLCYIQEQLGMAGASLQGAGDLLAAPREPKRGKGPEYGASDQGMAAQIRALIKFERWDDILKEPKPTENMPIFTALWHCTRAIAYANTARMKEALEEREAFRKAASAVPEDRMVGNSPAPTVFKCSHSWGPWT